MRFLMVSSFLVLTACVHGASQDRESDRVGVEKELSGEMSLKADREELKELRRDIPAEKQKSNDELAVYLGLMKQGTEQPQIVRDKFNSLVEKRRLSFRQRVQKLRDNYRRDETKRREEFLNGLKGKRASYLVGKRTPEQLRDFFSGQEKDRQAFFSDERERRTAFESDVMAQSKDFEAYMREKVNEANEQFRVYSKKFSERPKNKKAVTGESGDFQRMNELPAKHLGTD